MLNLPAAVHNAAVNGYSNCDTVLLLLLHTMKANGGTEVSTTHS
jgi:hypothetical protein